MKLVDKREINSVVGVVDWYLDQAAVVFPLWSALTHMLVLLLVYCSKALLGRSRRLKQYAKFTDEFLGTFGWICFSLEGVVVGEIWSRPAGLTLLFARLFLAPFLFKGSYTSPCGAFFDIFKDEPYSKDGFVRFFKILSVQLLATLVGVAYVVGVMWRVLAETVSDDHFHFNKLELAYYLQVWSMYGFGMEMIMTAFSFCSRFILGPGIIRIFLDSALCTFFVYLFSPLTGAMMNPLVALSLLLPWTSLDLVGYAEHFAVFWIAPFIATVFMLHVYKWYSRTKLHSD